MPHKAEYFTMGTKAGTPPVCHKNVLSLQKQHWQTE